MDETKIELPAWLPWATTACLAALVACLGELWIIEKTRTQLLRDENLLAEASLKGAQNQLEAERIVSRREIEGLKAAPAAGRVALLAAPDAGRDDPFGQDRAWGIAVWNAAADSVQIRFTGLPSPDSVQTGFAGPPSQGPDRAYQCWIEGPGPGLPVGFMVRFDLKYDSYALAAHLAQPVPPGYRILLIDGAKGGAATLEEAKARGSIVLASPPQAGKISN
jgi:hypothetical protein